MVFEGEDTNRNETIHSEDPCSQNVIDFLSYTYRVDTVYSHQRAVKQRNIYLQVIKRQWRIIQC